MDQQNHTGFSEVCDTIVNSLGLHFPEDRWEMLARNLTMAAPAFGFPQTEDFISWLLCADLKKKEIELLASYLTISETYFWREPQVFSALTDLILPEIVAAKKNADRVIRIWSVGCSTGEEAYSLAIAVHRAIPDIKDWKISILATDINPNALIKATSGIYSRWSFRNCPAWLKSGYFQDRGGELFEISPRIRKMVTFANLNLTADLYPSHTNHTQSMDIIFCRNVLMYFTSEWIAKISGNLFHALNRDGWFVVASCELSSDVFPHFKPVNFPGAVLYKKSDRELPAFPGNTSGPILHKVTFPAATAVPSAIGPVDVFSIADREPDFTPVRETNPVVAPEKEAIPVPPARSQADAAKQISQLAGQGDLLRALALCDAGIAEDKLATGLYFMKASILQELNKIDEAIASVKQAIYLDQDFVMGHFALGNLYLRQGKKKEAKKYFSNVLELSKSLAMDEILPESDGLPVKYIREIVFANMQEHPNL